MKFLLAMFSFGWTVHAAELPVVFHEEGCSGILKLVDKTSEGNRSPVQLLWQAHCSSDPLMASGYYKNIELPEASIALGERHYLMGNYSTAAEYFEKAKEKMSGKSIELNTLEYWKGLSLYGAGKRKEAEKILKKLYDSKVKVCETGFNCLEEGNEKSGAPVVGALVKILDYNRHWTQASKILKGYLNRVDSPSIRWVLELRLSLGHFYFRLQKTRLAYLEFARILRFYPQSAQAQWLRDHYAYAEILKKYGSKVSSLQ